MAKEVINYRTQEECDKLKTIYPQASALIQERFDISGDQSCIEYTEFGNIEFGEVQPYMNNFYDIKLMDKE